MLEHPTDPMLFSPIHERDIVDQLAALVSLIAVINAYNRLNVIVRQPAGAYQPGQWS